MVTKNKELADKARFLASQSRDKAPHYQHSCIGYNYRMSNICAGIGRGQMQVLNERIKAKREIFNNYTRILKNVPGIFPITCPLFPVRLFDLCSPLIDHLQKNKDLLR